MPADPSRQRQAPRRAPAPRSTPVGSPSRRAIPRYAGRPAAVPPPASNAARGLGAAGAAARRLAPWLAAALAAYELWQYYEKVPSLTGYSLKRTCGGNCGTNPMTGNFFWAGSSADPLCSCSIWQTDHPDTWVVAPPRIYFGEYATFPTINPSRLPRIVWERNVPNTAPWPQQFPQDSLTEPAAAPAPGTGAENAPHSPGQSPAPGVVVPIPPLVPQIDPLAIPPLAPAPQPIPIPVPQIPNRPTNDPDAPPGERTERLPRRAPRARRDRGTERVVSGPRGQSRPSRYRRRPPQRGEKEKKMIIAVDQASTFGRALNYFTETLDWINCVHKGLPASRRSWDRTQQQKVADIYNGWSHIDWANVVYACVENQIEDYIFGRLGRAQARANRRLGISGAGSLSTSTRVPSV